MKRGLASSCAAGSSQRAGEPVATASKYKSPASLANLRRFIAAGSAGAKVIAKMTAFAQVYRVASLRDKPRPRLGRLSAMLAAGKRRRGVWPKCRLQMIRRGDGRIGLAGAPGRPGRGSPTSDWTRWRVPARPVHAIAAGPRCGPILSIPPRVTLWLSYNRFFRQSLPFLLNSRDRHGRYYRHT